MNYYEIELNKINFTGEHAASALFGCEGKVTKALAIVPESATAIIRKLLETFGTDIMPETDGIPKRIMRPAPAAEVITPRLYVYYTTGRDKNGNKVVRVKTSGRGGFTIQTNGNLPQTHRDGVTSATDAEVCAYVRRHGGARRMRILDIKAL